MRVSSSYFIASLLLYSIDITQRYLYLNESYIDESIEYILEMGIKSNINTCKYKLLSLPPKDDVID